MGLRDPTHRNPILKLVQRGVKRACVPSTAATRRPITTAILKDLLRHTARSRRLCNHDRRMLTAAFTLAFFGFLRVSEFSIPSSHQFDPRIHPSVTSIRWGKHHFSFLLKRSKTDQCSKGQVVQIHRTPGPICPFRAMSAYFAIIPAHIHPSQSPLFIFANGRPLTRHSCLTHLRDLLRRAGYPPRAYNTHSFRIGAATVAAQAGISSHMIKRLGRWRSGAYRRYIRTHTLALRQAFQQLGRPRH